MKRINERKEINHSSKLQRHSIVGCFLGVFFSYTAFGLLQESLMKTPITDNVYFKQATCLVMFQSIFNTIVSYTVLISLQYNSQKADTIPSTDYALCSIMYMAAMVSSNSALKFVGYPLQVLGKSAKPVSVMALGIILARKRYPLHRYFCVLLIVLGVGLFLHSNPKSATTLTPHPTGTAYFGELLIMSSLIFDGLTGAIQERMLANHKVSAYRLMFQMNMWSCLWSWIASTVTGELRDFSSLVFVHPIVIWKMFLLSISGAIGQIFIFLTVEWFGPLACSIITTTRKFFTILLSVIFFRHPLTNIQWTGTLMVFTGLGLESVLKRQL